MPDLLFLTPVHDLQQQFDAAEPGTHIRLSRGEYRQKVLIRTPGLTIEGEDMHKTVIVWDDYANKLDENGVEYNTFRTWTVAVCASHITMRNLTVRNDALQPETKGQEVALSVLGNDFKMVHCRLSSTQDTLFAGPLPADLIQRYQGFHRAELLSPTPSRQVYEDCLIEGSVDFIFGCADALFDRCEIRNVYDVRQVGYVAAPAHTLEQEEGFLFHHCRFTSDERVKRHSIYLARPWRDWGLCRFVSCTLEDHIHPLGYDKWSGTERNKTARFHEYPPIPGRVDWVKPVEEKYLP